MPGSCENLPGAPDRMSDSGGNEGNAAQPGGPPGPTRARGVRVRRARSTMMGFGEGASTAMWKATIRGLLARKVRLVLTALAILLGVSFISATYVLTDTVKQSFDAVFSQTLSGVDLQVQGASSLGDSSTPARIPDSTVDQVREVPGVARAEGLVRTSLAQFVDRNGEAIGGGGPPTFGISWVDGGPLRLTAGRAPTRAGEVAMDAGTAREAGLRRRGHRARPPQRRGQEVPDRRALRVRRSDRLRRGHVRRVRPRRPRNGSSTPGPRSTRCTCSATRASPTRCCSGASSGRLGPGYDVLTADQATLQVGRPVRQFLGFFTYALLGFAAIGVVVGAFIIFNTFTILVAQRTRELGLLRAMGATGGQVVRSVVLEAFVVGAVASAIGLVAGIALGVGSARPAALARPRPAGHHDRAAAAHRRRVARRRCGDHGAGVGVPGDAGGAGPAGRRDRRPPAAAPPVGSRGRAAGGVGGAPGRRRRAGLRAWRGRGTSPASSTRCRWSRSARSACWSAW